MKPEEVSKIIMNPVRIRILQFFIRHGEATAAEIRKELTDVPQASLYRHLRTLTGAGALCVVRENRVRGTAEKVYGLSHPESEGAAEEEGIPGLIQGSLLYLMGAFEQYFNREDADPIRDMLCLGSSVLMLTDGEFQEFLTKVGELIQNASENRPGGGRKPRNITFIALPGEGERK